MNKHTMVIYTWYKFHEIPLSAYKVMAEDGKIIEIYAKSNNSSITDYSLVKLHMHNHTMVIYVQGKFHEIPSITYKVMPEDGKIIEIRNQRAITPL